MSSFESSKKLAELQDEPLVQVDFPLVAGDRFSSLHTYSSYSGLKSEEPWIGECPTVLINSIAGILLHNKQIETHCNSKLQLRVPISFASRLYALAGKRLSVGQGSICLQAPTISPLRPKRNLYSRLVVFHLRDFKDVVPPPDRFLATAHRKLEDLGVRGELSLAMSHGKLVRRVVKVKERFIAGYAVEVKRLSETDSLKLQQFSIGGKLRMGAGWFE